MASKFFLVLSLLSFTLALVVFFQDIPWLADKISIVALACYAVSILILSFQSIITKIPNE